MSSGDIFDKVFAMDFGEKLNTRVREMRPTLLESALPSVNLKSQKIPVIVPGHLPTLPGLRTALRNCERRLKSHCETII